MSAQQCGGVPLIISLSSFYSVQFYGRAAHNTRSSVIIRMLALVQPIDEDAHRKREANYRAVSSSRVQKSFTR